MHEEGRPRLDDVLLGVSLAAALALGLRFLDSSYDDAYITYRYARNLAEGHGFVYNLGVSHLGTTTPLYTLVLAVLGLAVDIPIASGLLSIASVCAAIVSIEGIGRSNGVRFAGPLAALFLIGEPQLYRIFGGETVFVHLGLLPAGLLLHLRGARQAAAVLFALAILGRMDAAVFVGLVYAWDTWTARRLPLREAAWIAGVLSPWVVWATWTFGSPLPATLWAKIAQGEAGTWKLFFEGAFPYLTDLVPYRAPQCWLFLPLLVLGLVQVILRERVWLFFCLATLLHALAYQLVLRSSFSHWYLASAYLTNAVVLGAGLRFLWLLPAPRSAVHGWAAPTARVLAGAAIAVFVASAVEPLARFRLHSPRRQIYTDLGEWLREQTVEEASVAYFEIGYLGYHSRRTIVDPVGLVTPGGLERIGKGELYWFFDAYEPDYYVHNASMGAAFIRAPWFRTHYVLVRSFEQKGFRGGLGLYRRLGSRAGRSAAAP